MGLYVIETDYGIGLTETRTVQQAAREGRADVGNSYFRSARKATKEDIAWVAAMGGYIPPRGRNKA